MVSAGWSQLQLYLHGCNALLLAFLLSSSLRQCLTSIFREIQALHNDRLLQRAG